MRPPSEPPRDLPDRVLRQALRHPANLRAFLRQVVPALADGFDCDRSRLLDREFPLDDWRRREADLPFEVPYRLGDQETWALVYVLLEHQSAEDPAMPLRLLYFAVLYGYTVRLRVSDRPPPGPAGRSEVTLSRGCRQGVTRVSRPCHEGVTTVSEGVTGRHQGVTRVSRGV